MNPAEVVAVLEDKGAILRGHFRLSSGKHSDVFVQKFRVLEHPRLAQRLGEEIAGAFGDGFDVVASPAVGAIILGFTVALAADARVVFAERVGESMEFRRGFVLGPREPTVIVEDVVTTGGSALEVVELVRSSGGHVVGVGALIDRTDQDAPPRFGAPFRALCRVDAAAWDPDGCPLCAGGRSIDDPGSRRLGS